MKQQHRTFAFFFRETEEVGGCYLVNLTARAFFYFFHFTVAIVRCTRTKGPSLLFACNHQINKKLDIYIKKKKSPVLCVVNSENSSGDQSAGNYRANTYDEVN